MGHIAVAMTITDTAMKELNSKYEDVLAVLKTQLAAHNYLDDLTTVWPRNLQLHRP